MPKLKFLAMSDAHEEFELLRLPEQAPEGISFILAAGDIWTKGRAVRKLEIVAAWAGVPLIVTAGNHDYYGDSIFRSDARMKQDAEGSAFDIRYLNPGVTEVDGCRIIGATLWTDYRLRIPPGADNLLQRNACAAIMNDHKRIRWGDGSFRPVTTDDLASIHQKHKEFIRSAMAVPHDGPTIIMTHHAPSELSIRDLGNPEMVDAAYASNLEEIILDGAPDVWIHGHTHVAEDYGIGATRVISNPKGYPGQNPAFDICNVFEVDVRIEASNRPAM